MEFQFFEQMEARHGKRVLILNEGLSPIVYSNCVSYLKLKLDFKNKKDNFRDDSMSMLHKLKDKIEGKQEIVTDVTDEQVNK